MESKYNVNSPCINVCIIDTDSGFCEGCWRTLDEVNIWRRASDQTKLDIIERLHQRQQAAGGKVRRQNHRQRTPS